MIFRCTAPPISAAPPTSPTIHADETIDPDKKLALPDRVIYLDSERWFDAREVAQKMLGMNVELQAVEERPTKAVHKGEFYAVTWTGNGMRANLERVVKPIK
jgi:hypothetical protein